MLKTRMRPLFQNERMQKLLLQSPVGIKVQGCPWHFKVPQKTIGTMPCPRELDNRPMVWFQYRVAHDMGKRVF